MEPRYDKVILSHKAKELGLLSGSIAYLREFIGEEFAEQCRLQAVQYSNERRAAAGLPPFDFTGAAQSSKAKKGITK